VWRWFDARSPGSALARAGVLLLSIALATCPVAGDAFAAERGPAKHTVAEGQSLRSIAKRYGIQVEALALANELDTSKPLKIGTVLDVPSPEEAERIVEKGKRAKKRVESDQASKKDGDREKRDEAAPKKPVDRRWWLEKPPARTQTQKESKDRGGVHPCMVEDPGFGVFEQWNRAPTMGQALIPARGGVTKAGSFDLMVHFHGHDPARKEWVKVVDGTVLVGITLGIGSGVYSSAFTDPAAFERLVSSVEDEVARLRGLPKAKARKVGISAWSAGYGAVERILSQEYGKKVVDTVVLLDGLHAGYAPDGDLDATQLAPFLAFAKRAKAGQKLMYLSHSSIIPPGYASTTETAHWLVHQLGGKPKPAKPRKSDPMGLDLNSRYDAGGFHVRGYDGNDKPDHCAHIGLLRDVAKVYLKSRWNSPKGYGPAPAKSTAKPVAKKK
jgi:LysM repeat protein